MSFIHEYPRFSAAIVILIVIVLVIMWLRASMKPTYGKLHMAQIASPPPTPMSLLEKSNHSLDRMIERMIEVKGLFWYYQHINKAESEYITKLMSRVLSALEQIKLHQDILERPLSQGDINALEQALKDNKE